MELYIICFFAFCVKVSPYYDTIELINIMW